MGRDARAQECADSCVAFARRTKAFESVWKLAKGGIQPVFHDLLSFQ